MRTSRARLGLVFPLVLVLPALAGLSCGGGNDPPVSPCGALDDCAGECVDTSFDLQNCGACGNECQDGEVCSEGACLDFCGDGLTVCNGLCVNTAINEQHCGGCGLPCPPGVTCADSACGGGDCASLGLVDCNGFCVDIFSDPAHCGGCNAPCGPGGFCAGGDCQAGCPPGLVDCGGFCADIFNDPFNCGDCFNECGPGGFCSGAQCQLQCPPDLVDCGGVCVDIFNDPFNCGFCFNDCGPGGFCSGAQCQFECPPGLVDCGGFCADIFNDPFNCGGCFNECPGGQCSGAMCTGDCTGICGACTDPIDLGAQVPQSIAGSTFGLLGGLSGICGGSGAPEQPFFFTAPAAGSYVFDTVGSTYDTLLHVRNLGCNALACNDDTPAIGLASQVTVPLGAGETVLVAVDGFGASQGDYTLNVTTPIMPGCPDQVLPSMVPLTVSGSTVGAANELQPGCVGAVGPEATLAFTAPVAKSYIFNTLGSNYDTVLSVRNASCNGMELACNDDFNGLSSQVTVFLNQNQSVVVVVDGFGPGNYMLTIQ